MNSGKSAQITILAIDDERESLAKMANVLESAGYHCLQATDRATAQAAASRVTPDLIISDLNLAGHSGASLCEQLKAQIGLADLPVMFLSTTQRPDIIRRADGSGGSYYLRKPCDAAVLLQLVEKARLVSQLAGA